MTEHRHFVPAAGHDWLLPFYDPLLKLLGIESVRRQLIDQVAIEAGHEVLDIGCGTGTLAVMIKSLHPDVQITGLDPDPKALARAKQKAQSASVTVQFDLGYSDSLPYEDDRFDRIFSSFMFHHLDSDVKRNTLIEARRVLKPGGALHLIDFGGSHGRSDGWLARLLHSRQNLEDNFSGAIPVMMNEAGFADTGELAHRTTLFGGVSHYRAVSPNASA